MNTVCYSFDINKLDVLTLIIDKAEFAARLNQILDDKNIPGKSNGRGVVLSEMMAVTPKAAWDWLNGDSLPSRKRRKEMAELFNVSLEYLEYGIVSKNSGIESKSTLVSFDEEKYILPVINLTKIRKKIDVSLTSGEKIEINLNKKISANSFITYQNSNSMSPVFEDGTLLVIDPDFEYKSGHYVLAIASYMDNAIIRRYIKTNNTALLVPISSQYTSIKIDDKINILGTVVLSRTELV